MDRLKPHAGAISILLFAVLGFVLIYERPIWRDEAQFWLILRDSASVADLLDKLQHEGHPPLFYLLSYPLSQRFVDPLALQVLHWAIGVIGICFFWWAAPFRVLNKILFTFGFFPFYEYFVVARSYGLVLLLIMITASLTPLRRRTYIPLGLVLGLLAMTHGYSLVIACVIAGIAVGEWMLSRDLRTGPNGKDRSWDPALALTLFLVLLGAALYPILATPDVRDDLVSPALDAPRIFRAAARMLQGLTIFLPNPTTVIEVGLIVLAGLLVLLFTAYWVRHHRFALGVLLFATTSLLVFMTVIFAGTAHRHGGFFFLIFLFVVWVRVAEPQRDPGSPRAKRGDGLAIFGTLALVVHLCAAIAFHARDAFVLPPSAGKVTAAYLVNEGLENRFIIGSESLKMAPLSVYMDRAFYAPQTQAMATYAEWGTYERIDLDEVLRRVGKVVCRHHPELGPEAYSTTNPPLFIVTEAEPLIPRPGLSLIASFTQGRREQYLIYEIDPVRWPCPRL